MGTTGLIYVAIVAAWAAYLVPMWLRRHDEASRMRSVERYSSAMRVLSRQTDDRDRARYVVRPKADDDTPRVIAPAPKRSAAQLRARRIAAMRRRRVLSILTLALLSVAALATFAIVPRWTIAVPAVLILTFVVIARIQVRREAARRVERTETRRSRKAARLDVSYAYGPATAATGEAEQTTEVPEPAEAPAETAAEAEPPAEGLWDPVPVTLPTYVYKEKAPRTVRTISLSGPDAVSSGRAVEPAEAAEQAESAGHPVARPAGPPVGQPVAEAEPEEIDEELEIRRAVGD